MSAGPVSEPQAAGPPEAGHAGSQPGGPQPGGAQPGGAQPGGSQPGGPDRAVLAALSVEEKVRLLSGMDSWRTHGAARIGLRPIIMSDGPAGVRGADMDERSPAACLPCPSALGATWDTGLVRELAAALGAEARSKRVDVLLAPTLNLMRTPLGGRGFECFAEDPELTARTAVAYVTGLQEAGVAATVKHYVSNDSETDRWNYDVHAAEHVLRELYLVPFEACVREAGVALVMAAYNAVNGQRMTEHARLLHSVLKGEWGFTGVVVSDWDATRSTVPAAMGGLDLAMPGPNQHWGGALAEAVREGVVPEEVLDDKVIRLLRLAGRAGALGAPAAPGAPAVPGHRARAADGHGTPGQARLVSPDLLRRAAASAMVLLRNEGGALPLDPRSIRRLAVIGPNALYPVIQGGGSAAVVPAAVSTPAGALREALAGRAEVTVVPGCQTWVAVPPPPPGSVRDPVTGDPGVRLGFLATDGEVLATEHRASTSMAWWDGLPPGVGWGEGAIVLDTTFRAGPAGAYLIGVAGVGRLTVSADGTVLTDQATPVPSDPVETLTRPGEVRTAITLAAGQAVDLRVEFRPAAGGQGPVAIRLGVIEQADDDVLLAEAEAQASRADAAIVVVGSAEATESEGFDRDTLALRGRQDELVHRVAAANPATVVVVNAGMPVLMPWASQVAAVLYAWLPGQAMGDALADVLLGLAEPGGRLPVTLPADEADCPVLAAIPADGRLEYAEGLLAGYRGYDAARVSPAFPFGHGMGYTTWDYQSLDLPAELPPGQDLELRVTVANTGQRAGREVVQAYVAGPPGPGRPVRVLGAFGVAGAGPGEAAEVVLRVPARVFAVWDTGAGGWSWRPGPHTVSVGRSSRDMRLSAAVWSG